MWKATVDNMTFWITNRIIFITQIVYTMLLAGEIVGTYNVRKSQ